MKYNEAQATRKSAYTPGQVTASRKITASPDPQSLVENRPKVEGRGRSSANCLDVSVVRDLNLLETREKMP